MKHSAARTSPPRTTPHLVSVERGAPTADSPASVPLVAPLPDLMRPADVAIRLGVTAGRIYQMVAGGVLPCIHRGRSVRIPRAAYDRWLAGLADEAEAAVKR